MLGSPQGNEDISLRTDLLTSQVVYIVLHFAAKKERNKGKKDNNCKKYLILFDWIRNDKYTLSRGKNGCVLAGDNCANRFD